MNDDKLKKLFADYEPDIQSDAMFMARFERNLRAVEFIRDKTLVNKKQVRNVIVISGCVGFFVGLILSHFSQYMVEYISGKIIGNTLISLMSLGQIESVIDVMVYYVDWIFAIIFSVLSYNIVLGLVGYKHMKRNKKL